MAQPDLCTHFTEALREGIISAAEAAEMRGECPICNDFMLSGETVHDVDRFSTEGGPDYERE